jgi:hypothetical protein
LTPSQIDLRSNPSWAVAEPPHTVSVRRLPYPYRAILAICSDLDETPDRKVYSEIMRFLNTTTTTSMGPGLGLEVGNSIYFDMPGGQFSYWNTDDTGRAMVQALIRSGHIDCLHSFGDLAITRHHAARALDELTRHDCRLAVWVDHAVAPTNFGDDIMRGRGDLRGNAAYHADLTSTFGIQYVWRGRVTSVVGQDVRRSLRAIPRLRHPLASVATVLKEHTKGLLARCGSAKYAMHRPNRLLRETHLRDGRPVQEFIRANPHWGGVSRGDTANGLADVLTDSMLRRLVQREAVAILYTHLGKVERRDKPLGPATREALRRLARWQREGRILVTTTRRTLDYSRLTRDLKVSAVEAPGELRLRVTTPEGTANPGRALAGLTLYVPDRVRVRLSVDGCDLPTLDYNRPDHTGCPSVSIPWPSLEFPRP